mmetsp:Transcript_14316/g.25589  ORF Transcript_14316/g.25589 Transcript_14316/m.25589 type:complete len:747 (-) Transcript_14316:72-2312(-)
MLRVRGAAMARTSRLHALSKSPPPISRCLWIGKSHPTQLSEFKNTMNHHQSCAGPRQIQRRGYIFLPASLSDASKQLKTLFENNQQSHKRLMVKLQNRWRDTLYSVQERIQVLKKIQRKQRKIARQSAHATRNSMMNRSAKYSLFVRNMQGKVGSLSSVALSQGKRNLISHYNAKKRVYTRRKVARQLARKMGGKRTLIGVQTWKSNYVSENNKWGWMRGNPANNAPVTKTNSINNNTTWKGITLTEPVQQSWFDDEGYPLTSRDPETGRFVNPWLSESTNGENGLTKLLRWKIGGPWGRFLEDIGVSRGRDASEEDKEDRIDMGSPNMGALLAGKTNKIHGFLDSSQKCVSHEASPPSDASGVAVGEEETINLTWIGHSSTIVSFPGDFTILTDPHFSNYAGYVRRNTPSAFGVADLPDVVDCVLISHDHMDHLDYWSILALIESSKVKIWIVPLGIKSWLMDKAGVSPEDIVELEWWEGVRIRKSPKCKDSNENKQRTLLPQVEGLVRAYEMNGKRKCDREQISKGMPDRNELVITCAPAQHWCSRTPFDRNRRLWCSFAVHSTPALSKTHSFYFAGDTGLPPDFPLHHQIGDRLGPFDLSAIPIGAYEPDWFMRETHCNPAEAVKIHQAVKSRRSVAIHFDTFDLADEPREEPPKLLLNEVGVVNKKIGKMATEMVAIASEIGIATGRKGHLAKEESVKDTAVLSQAGLTKVGKANEQLLEMLPPLVDFAVIRQGQSIESLPK